MVHKLTDIPLGTLLGKFGAGSHKPGSGSASALQGMLSAQLLLTVIDLTEQKKHKGAYGRHLPRLLDIQKTILEDVYPELDRLFQDDAHVFGEVIDLRNNRDTEKDPFLRQACKDRLDETLRRATEIPIAIAECCLRLASFSQLVFDLGFRSARGDSGVAANGAISAVFGCLNIVELNLQSLPLTDWTEQIIEKKHRIKAQCRQYAVSSMDKLEILEQQFQSHLTFQRAIAKFRKGRLASTIRSDKDLENLARELQNAVWEHKGEIWKTKSPEFAIQSLKPDMVFKKVMGYTYSEETGLGTYMIGDERFEVAGIIDRTRKVVQVSQNFPTQSMLFTAAHELGHAVLHQQTVLHRDRSLDGSSSTLRMPEEEQANKFAAYFLMPAKLVRFVFGEMFKTTPFVINEASILALRQDSVRGFRSRCQSRRGLAREIAKAEYFAGASFQPLCAIFGVSIETMAIRLEELGLVQF